MEMNINNLVSISEAGRDFSKLTRLVDETGTAIIMMDDVPRYVLLDYSLLRKHTVADDALVETVASRILAKHIRAFEELAK